MSVHSEVVKSELVIQKPRANRLRSQGRIGSTASEEVREWLKSAAIKEHWYFHEINGKLHIAFHNPQDAMLYKLAWH